MIAPRDVGFESSSDIAAVAIEEEYDTDGSDEEETIIYTPGTTPSLSRRESTSLSDDEFSSFPSSGIMTPVSGCSSSELGFPDLGSLACPLCCSKRTFRSISALQRHLQSPAHGPTLYRCPTFLFPEFTVIQREFKTLGGLLSHLQAGACAGGLEMSDAAMRFVAEKLGIGAVRLLGNSFVNGESI